MHISQIRPYNNISFKSYGTRTRQVSNMQSIGEIASKEDVAEHFYSQADKYFPVKKVKSMLKEQMKSAPESIKSVFEDTVNYLNSDISRSEFVKNIDESAQNLILQYNNLNRDEISVLYSKPVLLVVALAQISDEHILKGRNSLASSYRDKNSAFDIMLENQLKKFLT